MPTYTYLQVDEDTMDKRLAAEVRRRRDLEAEYSLLQARNRILAKKLEKYESAEKFQIPSYKERTPELPSRHGKHWAGLEIDTLFKFAQDKSMSVEEAASYLRRTPQSVRGKCSELGYNWRYDPGLSA